MLGKNDLAFPEYRVKYPLFLLANPYLYARKLLEITEHLAGSTEHALEHYMVNLYPVRETALQGYFCKYPNVEGQNRKLER
jgi:hypothetical protein